MQKPKLKTILKYALIAYLAYLVYNTPKTSWNRGEILETTNDMGQIERLAPNQSSYAKYILAWWKTKISTIGITGIIDQYILAPMGINFDEDKNNNDKK